MTIAPKCCKVNVAQLLSRSTVDVLIIILAAEGVWGFYFCMYCSLSCLSLRFNHILIINAYNFMNLYVLICAWRLIII